MAPDLSQAMADAFWADLHSSMADIRPRPHHSRPTMADTSKDRRSNNTDTNRCVWRGQRCGNSVLMHQQSPPPQQYGGYGAPPPQQYNAPPRMHTTSSHHHKLTSDPAQQQYNRVGGGGPPPPPTAPQGFGHGAPNGYSFQYSACDGRRKALLIGINYFGQRGQLRGCINDVKNMSTYLNSHFNYKREDMVLLTDDQQNPMSQPTKANILRAMHWLVKDARPNDSLFFHYSGTLW